MKKRKRYYPKQSIRERRDLHVPPGSSPGTLTVPADSLKTVIRVTSFNNDTLIEKPLLNIDEMRTHFASFQNCIHWFEVKGFNDSAFLEQLCVMFEIHPLEMEDVINSYQRPKMEEHDNHIFMVSRFLHQSEEGLLNNEQLSVFAGDNFVLTLQENYVECFEPVRQRLRKGKGKIRVSGTGYLAYALNDDVIDNYFPILERIGERLDELEDLILSGYTRETMQKLQMFKRELIVFRRSGFAERDKVNDILRTPLKFINDDTKVYLRDTYDHIIQAIELVESYREVAASLMDIYLSVINNKMNQVMKVMAVFSALFLPLSFIAGVYGMNFSRVDPETGRFFKHNMPELYSEWGYFIVLGGMLLVAIIEMTYFIRKGWMFKD